MSDHPLSIPSLLVKREVPPSPPSDWVDPFVLPTEAEPEEAAE
jgi:hypothetical protein